jgi:polygalacturonase
MIGQLVLCLAFVLAFVQGRFIDFEKIGAVPNDSSMRAAVLNGNLFNRTINTLQPGDTFFVANKTYWVTGGIKADGLYNVTIQVDGTVSFVNERKTWPKKADGSVEECIYLTNIEKVVFTSSGKGTFDGNGTAWWGAIKFLKHQEDRPRLVHIKKSKDILVENLLFKNSPYWTFYAEDSDGLLIRHSDVDARWTNEDYHTLIDLQAFNTDGFDVTGKNVYIHDSYIWNQDDCISVKDGSENMLFERITCSGLGLVVGSIGRTKVANITFRDSYLPRTVKGIYMKTRWYDDAPLGKIFTKLNIQLHYY